MQDFPHHYTVTAIAKGDDVRLDGAGLPTVPSAPPREFGGPGDRWSPETLLVASVADCFVLTFRAIARLSNLAWSSLSCEAEGTLERIERITQFTGFTVRATLCVPPDTNVERAQHLLEKAEQVCLVTNSLKAAVHLEASVQTA